MVRQSNVGTWYITKQQSNEMFVQSHELMLEIE